MSPRPDVHAFTELSGLDPLDVVARWPRDRPLVVLHSGRTQPRWSRWSILASPTATLRFGPDGRSRWVGEPPALAASVQLSHDPLTDLDAVLDATRNPARLAEPEGQLPFRGGWIGMFSYDLGRVIEPRATHSPRVVPAGAWPLIDLQYCPAALVYDNVARSWSTVGDVRSLMGAMTRNPDHRVSDESLRFNLSSVHQARSADEYIGMVGRTIEYIRAGDVFQANIAQRFDASLCGSPRGLAIAALEHARPWYGAYMELSGEGGHRGNAPRSILSLSPELFLQVEPGNPRRVTTRPIKGTRPPGNHAVQDLRRSAKDAAELHMIVDLMRNDLGRVCEFGSVTVPEPRAIESHPTVHHGVAEVSGLLRENVSCGDLLRATFPGGSVTGAPKIRAMQIIDELEPEARGPYCGSIGYFSNCGRVGLNIAIRTALIEHDGAVRYFTGAGIVADSQPLAEYRETLDKAAVLRTVSGPHPQPATL